MKSTRFCQLERLLFPFYRKDTACEAQVIHTALLVPWETQGNMGRLGPSCFAALTLPTASHSPLDRIRVDGREDKTSEVVTTPVKLNVLLMA